MCTNRAVVHALLTAFAVLLVLGPASAQEDEASFADGVKAECKDFKANWKKRPDDEVTAQIDKLIGLYKDEKADEKNKKDIVNTVAGALRARSDDVVVHCIKALGATDDVATKYLDAVLTKALKVKPPQVDRYEACFTALGKIASPKSIKGLTGYLKYKDYEIIAQAAVALKGYKDSRGTYRKQIFEELLKISEGLYSSAESNPQGEPAKKWRVIGTSMMEAMNAVGHQELSNPTAARKWFNEVKKQNWDK